MMAAKTLTETGKKQDTRELLLLAAMELFATQGIRATSLRQVNEAAGTKNSGAVHYYFKNKYGLIEAVCTFIDDHLITDISDDELADAGLPRVKDMRGVRRIIYEHFLPLMVTHDHMPWGRAAVGFLAHLMMEPDPKVQKAWDKISPVATDETIDALAREIPTLPRAQLERRYLFAIVSLIHGLADADTPPHAGFGGLAGIDDATFFVELIDYISAGIRAKP